jgi:hypothetical protein
MTLEITFEPADEALTIILDDASVLKVTLGAKGELVLNDAFKELEDENNEVYNALRKVTRELFELQDVV